MDALALELPRQLRCASTFEAGARHTLHAALARAAAQLSGQPVDVLRGMVHLRPGGVYRGLVVASWAEEVAPSLLPSATVWRLLAEHQQPVLVSIRDAQARLLGHLQQLPLPATQAGQLLTLEQSHSVVAMSARSTSHLCALPLFSDGDTLVGVVSVELAASAPIPDALLDGLARALLPAVEIASLRLPQLPVTPQPVEADPLMPVVGQTVSRLLSLLRIFSRQDETILLSGETGVGKSRLALWCHRSSACSAGPFETVHLSAVPEEMQLASLFGWKRGAFTGAVRDTAGSVSRAEGGTLFLDEIDKLSLRAQAGLLRLLEQRRYRVVGDPGAEKAARVRFIVGTNADLSEAVAGGRFLKDLYYRINVFPVQVPPLRERRDEIGPWTRFMIQRRHQKAGLPGAPEVSEGAIAALCAQLWPGNLRQLDNVVRRAYAISLTGGLTDLSGLVLERSHVEAALGFEGAPPGSDGALLPQLLSAARAFVGTPVDLGHADTFSSLVLHLAYHELGDLKAAFARVGRSRMVETRNHVREFRRRMLRVQALYEALGESPDQALTDSLSV